MATNQNILHKTLASEIRTTYRKHMVDWDVSLRKEFFLAILHLF